MNKAEFNALEKLFAAEIEAAMNEHSFGIVQSKAKVFRDLAEQGLVEEKTLTLGGRFPMTIKGWALTPQGHYAYCSQCF